jgi:hypothetical protein
MPANHIHDAIGQVRRMRELVLSRQRFKGYSGQARMAGGVLAIAGAGVMSRPGFSSTPAAHLAGWGVVLLLALLYQSLADGSGLRDR